MFSFKMMVGDWSNDGHGQCVDFVVSSNKPVEHVREAHYLIRETTGIDMETLCNEYDDSSIPDDVADKLEALGFHFEAPCSTVCPSPKEFASLWVFLLQKADPELQLSIEDIPQLQFYGYDSKGRHIEAAGYGLFTDAMSFVDKNRTARSIVPQRIQPVIMPCSIATRKQNHRGRSV